MSLAKSASFVSVPRVFVGLVPVAKCVGLVNSAGLVDATKSVGL